MPTTLTTRTYRIPDGALHRPDVRRVFDFSTLSSGTTQLSAVYDTRAYSLARVYELTGTLAANSTLAIQVLTGSVSSNVEARSGHKTIYASSNVSTFDVATTAAGAMVFRGLDKWTMVQLVEAGGSTSQDVAVDVEFL